MKRGLLQQGAVLRSKSKYLIKTPKSTQKNVASTQSCTRTLMSSAMSTPTLQIQKINSLRNADLQKRSHMLSRINVFPSENRIKKINSSNYDIKKLITIKSQQALPRNFQQQRQTPKNQSLRGSKTKLQILFDDCIQKYLDKASQDDTIKDRYQVSQMKNLLSLYIREAASNNSDNRKKEIENKLNQLRSRNVGTNFSKLLYLLIYDYMANKLTLPTDYKALNRDIQYYSRKLQFFPITLKACFDMGSYLCQKFLYQKAIQYYLKAMKLAVFIEDKYHQQVAIDKMGLCKYYLGNIGEADYYHRNCDCLPQYQRNLIKNQYNNHEQIQILFEENNLNFFQRRQKNNKLKPVYTLGPQEGSENSQFDNFLNLGEVMRDTKKYAEKNILRCREELKQMAHNLHFQSQAMLTHQKMKKISNIGSRRRQMNQPIRRNCFNQNFWNKSTNQVCITHKSKGRSGSNDHHKKLNKDYMLIEKIFACILTNI